MLYNLAGNVLKYSKLGAVNNEECHQETLFVTNVGVFAQSYKNLISS